MPLKRDIFLMSFGPDPVQAEFCISIIYGSYCGDGTDAVQRQSWRQNLTLRNLLSKGQDRARGGEKGGKAGERVQIFSQSD